jgi:Rieske Fe-S protein
VADRLIAWASGRPPASATGRGRGGRRAAREAAAAAAAGSSLDAPLRDRRTVLQAGVLGVLAIVAASLAIPFRSGAVDTTTEPDASGAGSGSASEAAGGASGSPAAGASVSAPPAGGLVVAHVADLGKTGARAFTVPFTAPAPLPAGDPAVIVKLADGSVVAFDAVCTHAGCTVEWDQADRLLICPCHDAVFDPAANAAVLAGPTRQPLAPIPVRVDQASGAISLGA